MLTLLKLYLVKNSFDPQLVKPTITPDVISKKVKVEDNILDLRIWDTAGSEKFRALNRAFYRNIQGALVLYSINSKFYLEY